MSVFTRITSNQQKSAPAASTPAPRAASAPSASKPASSAPTPASSSPSSQRPISEQRTSQSSTSQIAASSGRNMLSSDVEIKGHVRFTNDLVVDGKIEGEIDSDGSLTVGENARVRAEIRTRSVVIYGKVHGNIIVSDRVEIKANAELVGDIKAATLSIEAGAIFVGKSTVGAPSKAAEPAKTDAAKAPEKKESAPTA